MALLSTQTLVNLPIEKTWELYFGPTHVVHWNQASPEWHCPRAESDLRVGGRFAYRMEAKDGSFGFDFKGTFDQVNHPKRVTYTLDDGRKVAVNLSRTGASQTEIVVAFEPENHNPLEMQQGGWQAILDNFKAYAESVASTGNKIVPSLWFVGNAGDAMKYYVEIFGKFFPNSRVNVVTPNVVTATLAGVDFIGINGPDAEFAPNPAISFMVVCETREAVDHLWNAFARDGGQVYMALDTYPWSEYYGWIGDRYGYTWQLYTGKLEDVHHQAILPTLMFTKEQDGRCGEAVEFYARMFPGFQSDGTMMHHEESMKGKIAHTQFKVAGTVLGAMDGGPAHDFKFNERISLSILCKDQAEIDHYWNMITAEGKASQCGWCEDPFGVHWQVVPYNMKELLFDRTNPQEAFQALMGMSKIVIAELEKQEK